MRKQKVSEQFRRAYAEIIEIKREEPGITAGEIIEVLKGRGLKKGEIPTRATIGKYRPVAGTQLNLNLDSEIKRTAREMHKQGHKIAYIQEEVNRLYSVNYSCTAYRHWILGRKKQRASAPDLFKECNAQILERVIDESEAICWLMDRGVDEDEAFNWAMDRFCAAPKVTQPTATIFEMRAPSRPSKLKRAA